MQWKMYQHELIQSFIAGAMHIFCLLSLHQSYIASSKPWQWSCFKPVIKMCANNIMNGNMCESVHHSSAINQCIINYTHAVKYMYSIFSQFFFFYAFFFFALCLPICFFSRALNCRSRGSQYFISLTNGVLEVILQKSRNHNFFRMNG